MKKINSELEYNEIINDGLLLVNFYADWCGPCKMFDEVLKEYEEEHDNIKIVCVDTDRFRGIAKINRILSVPTVMVFDNGKLVKEKKGFMMKNELETFLNEE